MTTEPVYAREYVHAASIGDRAACEAAFAAVAASVERALADGVIEGYDLLLLDDAADAQEQLVSDDWMTVRGETYPVLYLLLQPPQTPASFDADIGDAMLNAGFVRFR